jgi:hypothetical protein
MHRPVSTRWYSLRDGAPGIDALCRLPQIEVEGKRKYQVQLKSKDGPIDVYLISREDGPEQKTHAYPDVPADVDQVCETMFMQCATRWLQDVSAGQYDYFRVM